MTSSLFFSATNHQFEKVAVETALPEDPNSWPNAVLQELYKQVSFLADFEPHVVMDRVDAERGFGFGHVEVMNKTEIQQGAPPEGLAAAGVKQVRIPIIISDCKLHPFDVFLTEDSKVLPLTESRLRQAIFRPSAFDITARTPGDQSMIGQLYPPYRQNYGFGGGGVSMSAGMGKQGSVLSSILPTITEGDYNRFFDKFSSRDLQAAYIKNAAATSGALETLAQYQPGAVKVASVLQDALVPDVVQIAKVPGGYIVKSASHHYWNPKEAMVDRGQLLKTFGGKVALAADLNGSVTMATGEMSSADGPEADRYEPIKDFGMYKVRDESGREIVGYVFPNLLDVDGTPLPLCLFTNGSQTAVQSDIVGVRVGEGASLMEGRPYGHGCFYEVLGNGKAQATVPMTINGSMSAEGEVSMSGQTFDGRPVTVLVQPHLQKVVGVDDHMLVPETMRWLPLDKSDSVSLEEDSETVAKTASAAKELSSVWIRCGGQDSYSLSGPALEKFASEARSFLSFDDAIFLLAGLGADPEYAAAKLAHAYQAHEPLAVAVTRDIVLSEELQKAAHEVAVETLSKVPSLRRDLVKEAAVIPDPTAVDTILSLGFINPENATHFVSYLPALDAAQEKMCELLVAARLGLQDIPTGALEKAIHATEEVVEGLRVLALASNN